ncbi:hypothetical protein LEP1GSC074_2010 [Leptospira noguchii str. Hook]|nr:hypothetical protein LEP1GSC074_2010 [Leptospira noguchii str. Hook]
MERFIKRFDFVQIGFYKTIVLRRPSFFKKFWYSHQFFEPVKTEDV